MKWKPIATAPRDGTFILLGGPSGCTTTPLRVEVGRYYPAYRPLQPWQTHSNDDFTDGGPGPTHWAPLPELPEPDTDQYGNTDGGEFLNCSFPDCGCDGARLCMAKNGPSSAALTLNIEKRSRAARGEI